MEVLFSESYSDLCCSSKVYYGQILLNFGLHERSSTLLEEVVTFEWSHPTSLVVWPKSFGDTVDKFIRRKFELLGTDYVIVPSIINALYLLADSYRSLNDLERYEVTLVRLEEFCGILGDVFPISYSLLHRAAHAKGFQRQTRVNEHIVPDDIYADAIERLLRN